MGEVVKLYAPTCPVLTILENIMCATLKNCVHFNCLVMHWNKAQINTAYNTNWSAWSWKWVKIFGDRTANAL